MSPLRVGLVTVLAGTISIGVAVYGKRWLDDDRNLGARLGGLVGDSELLRSLPEFSFPDLDGRMVRSSRWAGHALILHFWATWCEPCRREMDLLSSVQGAYGERIQVVGIAIDMPEDVAHMVAAQTIDYPILLGGLEAIELSRRLGNRLQGLPYTVIFDAFGRRVYAELGELPADVLDAQVAAVVAAGKPGGRR